MVYSGSPVDAGRVLQQRILHRIAKMPKAQVANVDVVLSAAMESWSGLSAAGQRMGLLGMEGWARIIAGNNVRFQSLIGQLFCSDAYIGVMRFQLLRWPHNELYRAGLPIIVDLRHDNSDLYWSDKASEQID